MKKRMILLAAVCAAGALAGCTGGPSAENGFRYPEKTDGKESQLYASEEIILPAEAWETPAAERYDALDRFGAEGYWITLGETQFFAYVASRRAPPRKSPFPAWCWCTAAGVRRSRTG